MSKIFLRREVGIDACYDLKPRASCAYATPLIGRPIGSHRVRSSDGPRDIDQRSAVLAKTEH